MAALHSARLALVSLLAACRPGDPDREQVAMLFALDPRSAPPRAASAAVRAFGAMLFDADLGGAACRDCHPRDAFGQDGRNHGPEPARNTPALADVARQLVFGWDGARRDLAAVLADELAAHGGIAADDDARRLCGGSPALAAGYAAAFPGEPFARARLVDALAAHLDGFRTRGRWDRYVDGDVDALSCDERRGLATFVAVGCAACHAGRTLGGRSRHRLGAAVPFATADPGLAAITGRDVDRGFFRAPMLRLAARTGPWLHDGSIAELGAAVRLMAKHELDRHIDDGEVAAIVAFLRAAADVDPAPGSSGAADPVPPVPR